MTYELEEPFFKEKGKITSQKGIGNNRSQITFSGEGAMKGNVEVTNSGDFIEVQKGNNVTHAQGQGVLTTKDGSEKVSYTFHAVGNVTREGKPILLGSAIYSTDSSGKLAFINNVISFFRVEADTSGNFFSIERGESHFARRHNWFIFFSYSSTGFCTVYERKHRNQM